MSRRGSTARGALVLVLAACGTLAFPGRAGADGLAAARRAFLAHRDPVRLQRDLASAGEPADGPVMTLVRVATGETPGGGATEPQTRGLAALPEVLRALHDLDLGAAGRAAPCADCVDGGVAAGWAGALVRIRRGDDSGAIGRLLAPPAFEWERDAFALALLGAALPETDRRMLAAGGRAALERAAARGRLAAVGGTAQALAALDPRSGRQAFAPAVRALRRGADLEAAEALVRSAPSCGVPAGTPDLALEAALCAWARDDVPAVLARLAEGSPPAGMQASFLALRRAGRRARLLETGGRLRHAEGEDLHAVLVARMATALGAAAEPEEIKRWADKRKVGVTDASLPRRYLEQCGLVVLSTAGDAEAADAVLASGRPFLLLRLERTPSGYADVPVLVRGYDRRTGLWLLDEPDVGRPDVLPRAAADKARFVCAVPQEARALLERFAASPAARTGRMLEDALAWADAADLAGARAAVVAMRDGGGAVGDLYRAWILHRLATTERDDAALAQAHAAAERSRRTPPLLGFEEYVRGQALVVKGERRAGLDAFDRVERLEGPSDTIAMARFAALWAEGQRADALVAAEEAVRLAPLDSRVLFYRAAARAAQGDAAGARADLRRALDRQPDAVRVAVALAGLELEAGRPAAALDVVRETERQDPTLADNASLGAARRSAEMALIEAADSVEALQAVRRSREPETRRRLAFALADRNGEGEAAEALLREMLADEDDSVRVSTLRLYMRPWLRARVEADAVLGRRVCLLLAQDPAADVRAAAAGLLGRVGSQLSLRPLADALVGDHADADPVVRREAARALRGRNDAQAHAALVAALEDGDVRVRAAAIDVLFELTATTNGYEAEADEWARAEAVALWRAWLAGE